MGRRLDEESAQAEKHSKQANSDATNAFERRGLHRRVVSSRSMKKPLAQAYQKILLPGSWYRFKEGSELASGSRPRAGGIPLIYSSVSSWSQDSSVAGVCEPPQVGCYRVVR